MELTTSAKSVVRLAEEPLNYHTSCAEKFQTDRDFLIPPKIVIIVKHPGAKVYLNTGT